MSSYALFADLRNYYKSLAQMILKKDYRNMKFEELIKIDLKDGKEAEKYFMEPKECFEYFKTERFKLAIDWNSIPKHETNKFAQLLEDFIYMTLEASLEYLPLNDEYVNLFSVLEPGDFVRETWVSIQEKFPTLVAPYYEQFMEDLDAFPDLMERINALNKLKTTII